MKEEGHIVKSYDEEIKDIKNGIVEMGSLVEKQLKDSLQCLKDKDTEFADKIIENDQSLYIIVGGAEFCDIIPNFLEQNFAPCAKNAPGPPDR